jgi:hypothetical protein
MATRLYSRWLTTFLDAIDCFFGDANMADRTLFPRAFGLRMAAPLWTTPSLDRCLLLALLYPIVVILILWAVSGHIGPAEQALGLEDDLPGWQRGLFVIALAFGAFLAWCAAQSTRRISRIVLLIFGTLGSVVAAIFADRLLFSPDISKVDFFQYLYVKLSHGAFASVFSIVFVLLVAMAAARGGVIAIAAAIASTLSLSFSRFAGYYFFTLQNFLDNLGFRADLISIGVYLYVVSTICAIAGTGAAIFVITRLYAAAIKKRCDGVFIVIFFAGMTAMCLWAAASNLTETVAPLLLFIGLMTLMNAPFDWASLGLTRALLRRGLELMGWWPVFLALVDALLAPVIIAILALTMVVGVQTFDVLANGEGEPLLALATLFDGIATHPAEPEYWWVYALLLSTMIPSLINLFIGGTALMRTVPGFSSILLGYLPVKGTVRAYDRAWIASVLTLQAAMGTVLGIAAQALLVVGFIGYVMPWLGLNLLDLARAVADLNLPMRVWQLFGGTL